MMDNSIHINPIKPVAETAPEQTVSEQQLPDVAFEEFLYRAMAQDKVAAERADAAKREAAEAEQAQAKISERNNTQAASLVASYSVMERLINTQRREVKDQQAAQQVAQDENERGL